jgi:hypothetical protein
MCKHSSLRQLRIKRFTRFNGWLKQTKVPLGRLRPYTQMLALPEKTLQLTRKINWFILLTMAVSTLKHFTNAINSVL